MARAREGYGPVRVLAVLYGVATIACRVAAVFTVLQRLVLEEDDGPVRSDGKELAELRFNSKMEALSMEYPLPPPLPPLASPLHAPSRRGFPASPVRSRWGCTRAVLRSIFAQASSACVCACVRAPARARERAIRLFRCGLAATLAWTSPVRPLTTLRTRKVQLLADEHP